MERIKTIDQRTVHFCVNDSDILGAIVLTTFIQTSPSKTVGCF